MAVAEGSVARDERALADAIEDAYSVADDAVRNVADQFIDNPRSNPQLTFAVSDSSIEALVEQKRLTTESVLVAWQSSIAGGTADAAKAKENLSAVTSFLADANAALNRAITSSTFTQATVDGYASDVGTARASINASVSSLSAAVSALDASKKNLALKRAGSTPQDIAAQEATVKAAAADVAQAQAQLNKTYLSAPFSGTITSVDAKVGKIVSPNTPEISMISTGAFQIESYIPEINIALLAVGDKATVPLDAYCDTPFAASVVSLDPAETVRDGVSTYRAVLQFERADERIKSGMTANVSITTDTKEGVLSVPQGLVTHRGGKAFVRVVTDGVVSEREVTLGGVSSLGEVEILSGLAEGEVVLATLP